MNVSFPILIVCVATLIACDLKTTTDANPPLPAVKPAVVKSDTPREPNRPFVSNKVKADGAKIINSKTVDLKPESDKVETKAKNEDKPLEKIIGKMPQTGEKPGTIAERDAAWDPFAQYDKPETKLSKKELQKRLVGVWKGNGVKLTAEANGNVQMTDTVSANTPTTTNGKCVAGANRKYQCSLGGASCLN